VSDTFLTREEVAELTGLKTKRRKVEQLRKMGLPFWLNAAEAPIVPRSAIEGTRRNAGLAEGAKIKSPVLYPDGSINRTPKPQWVPPGLRAQKK
jgi:hypothetical protein